MKISFLGWGSLIWDQRKLRIKGDWHEDGPSLPIEYRRLSGGGRITLVLYPKVEDVQTLWVNADYEKLGEAIENLRSREGTVTKNIGYVSIQDDEHLCEAVPGILGTIAKWTREQGLDAVVWTDLTENPKRFRDETEMELNEGNIIKYLKSLKGETLGKAKDYIQKTPEQVDTNLRRRIREELDW